MQIISVNPRGYCRGVVRAIQIAKEALQQYPNTPVTMLGMIVHNKHVVSACEEMGIRFVENIGKSRLELLDEIEEGVVIFTAHGVSDQVKEKAKAKGLITIDATCQDVEKTHTLVKNHDGHVIYIGKHHHPEAEGTTALKDNVYLVESESEIDALPADLNNILITTQTTLSKLDCEELIAACLKKYPEAKVAEEICSATSMRQEAVMKLKDKNVDVLIVVGDPKSNNSKMLKVTGEKAGIQRCFMIENVEGLEEEMVNDAEVIAVTSGSSTPNALTMQVIHSLEAYQKSGILQKEKATRQVL